MKTLILLILIIFISCGVFGQYPVPQTIGSDSALVTSKGGFKGRIINFSFADTTQANAQRIKAYPGAQIFTTNNNLLWLRNSAATAWIAIGTGAITQSQLNDTAAAIRSDFPAGNSGTVTNVTATSPLAITGPSTITPNITIPQSNASTNGYLSSIDWNTFNNKQPAGSYLIPADTNLIHGQIANLNSQVGSNTANILLKQNLVTLTTTGTSGPSTFNQSTGALNIPSYSGGGGGIDSVRKKAANSDSIMQHSAGAGTFAFRNQRVFNVRDYGADNTGVSDATVQIQTAIQAARDAHGGTVYFPNGTYYINGPIITSVSGYDPNSQLYIPLDSADLDRCTIKLLGESEPNYSVFGLTSLNPTSGVILKSGYTGTRSQTVAGTAIIGGSGPNIGGSGNGENLNYISVENINFVAKNNPNGNGPEIGGVNGRHMASLLIKNCTYVVDIGANSLTVPIEPISGFETSDCNNEVTNVIVNCRVYGARYGFVIGEHTSGDALSAERCFYGLVGKVGNHASSLNKVLIQNSRYGVGYYNNGSGCTISNLAPININLLDIEWNNTTSQWFKSIYAINDSLNGLYGNIRYWVTVNGTGGNGLASWTVNGAINVNQSPLGSGPTLSAAASAATSLTTPLIIGGTTTTSPLKLRSTSGAGTTGADIIFQTGNNGATEAMRILNSGKIAYGQTTLLRANNMASFVGNANSESSFSISNNSAGAGAYSGLFLGNSVSAANAALYSFSGGYTTSGQYAQGSTLMEAGTALGLSALVGNFNLYTNSILRMSITNAGGITFPATNTVAGTTGAQTINKPSGSVNIAAAGTTLVVTNSLVTASSLVFLQVYGTDATAKSATVTTAAGSFTITLNAAATNETKVAFHVIN